MMGVTRRSSLAGVASLDSRASSSSSSSSSASRPSAGRRSRGPSRASFAVIGVPVFILLALSAFGENASRRARTHARREGSVKTASRVARRFGGDEAVARLRATAVTTAPTEYEPPAPTETREETTTVKAEETTVAPAVVETPKEDNGVTTSGAGTPSPPPTTTGTPPTTGTTTTTTPMSTAETNRYAVVIDAGSTGSRVHVFAFKKVDDGLKLLEDTFEATKPGLSAKADDPKGAADSLRALMDIALKTVPESERARTSVEIRATAGLRLLPGDASKNILAECVKVLGEYPFKFDPASSVSIMDGADEGAFQWLTMNYLLGNLKGGGIDHDGDIHTVAAVDLGGGSVQLAYQVGNESAASAPDGYITKLKALGHSFDVYTRSHLGHGLMAARAAVLDLAKKDGESPCVHLGHDDVYEYAGEKYRSVSPKNGSDYAACFAAATAALGLDKDCDGPKDECSFNGSWGGAPGLGSKRVYLSSYLWDRAINVGIVSDDEIDGRSSVSEFKNAAEKACGVPLSSVRSKYHGVEEKDAPYLCMDLTFAHALLSKGFQRHAWEDFTLVKQIEYDGKPVEAAWALGAALNSM